MLQKVCKILISDIGLVISWLMVTPKNYVKMCTSVGSAALGSSPLKLSSPAMEYVYETYRIQNQQKQLYYLRNGEE